MQTQIIDDLSQLEEIARRYNDGQYINLARVEKDIYGRIAKIAVTTDEQWLRSLDNFIYDATTIGYMLYVNDEESAKPIDTLTYGQIMPTLRALQDIVANVHHKTLTILDFDYPRADLHVEVAIIEETGTHYCLKGIKK